MTDREQKLFDIAFGLHSRIPSCCIRFYTDEWDRFQMWKNEESAYVRAVNAAFWQYVPCPDCLGKGKKIKLRVCIFECGKEHREDFMPKEASNVH